MVKYIVRPKDANALAAVSLASTQMGPTRRTAQMRVLKNIRSENETFRELYRWIADAGRIVPAATLAETRKQVTGTTVLDLSPEEAERLKSEVSGLMVIRDRPITLIRPNRAGLTHAKLQEGDFWHLAAIGLDAARRAGFQGSGSGVTVAVLDTGVEASHPEIRNKITAAVTFDSDAWTVTPQTPMADTDGHGTHVAGLVCGIKVGVAPGARVASGVMIPGGFGELSDFVLALEWAASQPGISVINMSAGIPGVVEGMEDILADALAVGVLPIIATGNEGRNRTRSPGNYNPVLSVGACNEALRVPSFSSSGTMNLDGQMYAVPDLVAPGEAVTSCVVGGGYEAWDGTSMATPVVSGIAALILEQNPAISVLDLMETLIETCKPLMNVAPVRQGAGIATVAAAIGQGGTLGAPPSIASTGSATQRRAPVKTAKKAKKTKASKKPGRNSAKQARTKSPAKRKKGKVAKKRGG